MQSTANEAETMYRLQDTTICNYGIEIGYENDDYPDYYFSESIRDRLAHDETLSEEDKMVIQRLACRKFHYPGNTFWQDYFFWYNNNHPFACFFLADPRHPLGRRERTINLLASLAFGLAATCCVVLWFHVHPEHDINHIVFRLFGFDFTVGMLALMLLGGPLHIMFDVSIFLIQTCPPCRPGGLCVHYFSPSHLKCWLWIGANVAFWITLAAMALAINVMLVRASIEDDGDSNDVATDVRCYSFMFMYFVEVAVANFIVFPIALFVLLTGVLGCGRIPILGGRIYEIRKIQAMQEKHRTKSESLL